MTLAVQFADRHLHWGVPLLMILPAALTVQGGMLYRVHFRQALGPGFERMAPRQARSIYQVYPFRGRFLLPSGSHHRGPYHGQQGHFPAGSQGEYLVHY